MQALAESIAIFSRLKIISMGSCHMTDDNLITMCYQLPETLE